MAKKRVSQVNKEDEARRKEAFDRLKDIETELNVKFGAYIDYTQMAILPVLGCRVLHKSDTQE